MKEHPKGTRLSTEALAAYTLANGGAQVDATSDPYLITDFRPGRAPERRELKKRGREVSWVRR